MKLFSLMVVRAPRTESAAAADDVQTLAHATALDSFGYFERGTVRQFTIFFSKTVAARISLGQRSSVEQKEYVIHAHVRSSGLGAIAVCDKEYPARVAFTLLMKMQEDFMTAHPESAWSVAKAELPFPALDEMISKYQNPREADAIMRMQNDLDETKIVLHNTIESLLDRGVKLDKLVEKSSDLSTHSKMFYQTAKKQNSCCGFA
jgi:synaptobrevin homolog YKT6